MSEFSIRHSREFASEALNKPPSETWIERVEPSGSLVHSFVLPLTICQPFNRIGRAGTASQGWKLGTMKKSALGMMALQLKSRPTGPLPGRPHVVCVRFSSVATDSDSGWAKNPVDRLRVGKGGLGIIQDDKPKSIKLSSWWEPAPPKKGFVYVAVFEGKQ